MALLQLSMMLCCRTCQQVKGVRTTGLQYMGTIGWRVLTLYFIICVCVCAAAPAACECECACVTRAPPPVCTRHAPSPRIPLCTSKTPSGGTKDRTRSFSKRLMRTQGWKAKSVSVDTSLKESRHSGMPDSLLLQHMTPTTSANTNCPLLASDKPTQNTREMVCQYLHHQQQQQW